MKIDQSEINKIVNSSCKESSLRSSLVTPYYLSLEVRFKEWLRLLNFESTTITYAPVKAREFFLWLESRKIYHIESVNKRIVISYFDYLKHRPNVSILPTTSCRT